MRCAAIAASRIESVSGGEQSSEHFLVHTPPLREDVNNRHRHHSVIGIGPRHRGKSSVLQQIADHARMRKEPLTKGISSGEPIKGCPRSEQALKVVNFSSHCTSGMT
jgi:hypothetical protein